MSVAKNLREALSFAARNIPVFPLLLTWNDQEKKFDKRPLVKWRDEATTDTATIHQWAKQGKLDCGYGIPAGEPSGIFCLDVDGEEGTATLAALEAEYGELPLTPKIRTISGGLHLYFKYNQALADVKNAVKFRPGLDIRNTGGLFARGHTKAGKGYICENPGTPLAEVPDWIIKLLTTKKAPDRAISAPKKTFTGEMSVYAESALNGECEAVAAASKGTRDDTLNKAAFSLGQLVAGGELDQGFVESRLMDAALTCGLTEAEARKAIESGLTAGMKNPRTAPVIRPAGQCPRPATADEAFDGPPIPFDDIECPPLPLEDLPPTLGAFIQEVAGSIQVPADLVALNALACTAVALQGRAQVVVNSGYVEPLNVYAMIAMPPGERKSAAVESCKAPLTAWEARAVQTANVSRGRIASERRSLEKIIEARRGKLAAIKDRVLLKAEMAEIADLEAELPEIPATPRLFADDATPEALAVLMAGQKGRIGVVESEGEFIELVAGRYSSGVPNLGLVLKSWNGEALTVDRRRGDPVALKKPMLTICITAQPEVMSTLGNATGFRGRGLTQRFLYLLPQSRVGFREIDVAPIAEHVAGAYARKIEDFLDIRPAELPDGAIAPHAIRVSPEAEALRKVFAEHIEISLREGGDLESLREWACKLPGNTLRLAGLIHFWAEDRPLDAPISKQTIAIACEMASVLTDHAKAAFALMGANEKTEGAKRVLKWIMARPEPATSFTARECYQGVRRTVACGNIENLRSAFKVLTDHNYILEVPKVTGTAGRPSQVFWVNPKLAGGEK